MKVKSLIEIQGSGIVVGTELDAVAFLNLPDKYQNLFGGQTEDNMKCGNVVVHGSWGGYYMLREGQYERISETLNLRFGDIVPKFPVITEESELYVLGAFDADTGIFKRFIRKGRNGNISGYSSYESALAGRNHGSNHASDEIVKIVRIDKMVVLEDEK